MEELERLNAQMSEILLDINSTLFTQGKLNVSEEEYRSHPKVIALSEVVEEQFTLMSRLFEQEPQKMFEYMKNLE